MLPRRAQHVPDGLPIPKAPSRGGRINKAALTFGEPERIRDRTYLDSANGRPCSVPGCHRPAACAAHIRTGLRGGTALKPSDDETDWLCDDHHKDQENNPGPEWWLNNIYVPQRKAAYRAERARYIAIKERAR